MKDREKGSVLVLVMVSVVALLILGTVLAGTGSTEIKETVRQEQKMQAFYLARSGAEAVASSIIKEPGKAGNITGKGFSDSVELEPGKGTFKVEVKKPSEEKLLITSEGKCGRMKETVTLTLEKANVSIDNLFDRVIFSNNDLDISKATIVSGDIESKGKIGPEDKVRTLEEAGIKVYEDSTRVYPSPNFPKDIDLTQNKLVVQNKNDPKTIYTDSRYNELEVKNGTLTVETGGEDIRVVAGTVEIKGELVIKGGGRLLLFVTGGATLQTSGVSQVEPGSLIIFMNDGKTVTLIGNPGKDEGFNGFIYAPTATVILQSAQTEVHGAIIANRLVKNWNENKEEGSPDFQATLLFLAGLENVPGELDDYFPDITDTVFQRRFWQ